MNYYLEILKSFYKFKNLHFNKFLPSNLSHGECFIIMKLNELNKEITISDISDVLNVSPPALSRTIKHLEEKKYIKRVIDEKDRRNNFLKLSSNGKKIATKVENCMKEYYQIIYDNLGEKRLNDFLKCLNDIYEISLKESNNN